MFRVEDDAQTDHNPDTGWQGGFTCIIGNPPWERVKLQEQEFFTDRRPEIANALNAAKRKKMIEDLKYGDDVDRALYPGLPVRAPGVRRMEPPTAGLQAAIPDRPGRHQHLRRVRRDG